MEITFLGGAGGVTGSKFLLTIDKKKILIDCGLFQGLKNLRLRNWDPLPVDPKTIQAVLLTHAHLDHSGYIPRLLKEGFRGPVYCTKGTRDLCSILLPDSGFLQEEDAAYANRKGYSKHNPALPLYTEEEARNSLKNFKTVPYHQRVSVGPLEVVFHPAGHILGASFLHIKTKHGSFLFSGDVGRPKDILMPPPESPPASDYVFLESTYGNRVHPSMDPIVALKPLVASIVKSKGVLLVPAFAVGRIQALLLVLFKLFRRHSDLKVPVFVNSPMATEATMLLADYIGAHRISASDCKQISKMAKFVKTVDESIALNERKGPMIVLSASGMLTGGRVLHHLKKFGSDPKNILLFPGYQAPGTRGASLIEGNPLVKVHGGYVRVKAQVEKLEMFSAHADQNELVQWLANMPKAPKKVFLVHGEPAAADALRLRLEDHFHIPVTVAELFSRVLI